MTDSDDLLVAYQHGAASMKDELEKVQAERDKLRSILGRYANDIGVATGILYEDYGSLKKDEQALVRTLADIWEKADDAI